MWNGIALDHIDDNGFLLRELFPHSNMLPPFVKLAAVPEKDSSVWAVDTAHGGARVQQYPINDVGNTWVSSVYFEKTGQYLPPEIQQAAAVKLAQACRTFTIPVLPFAQRAELGETTYVPTEGPIIKMASGPEADWVPDHKKVRTSLVTRMICVGEDDKAALANDFSKLAFSSARTMEEQLTYLDNKYNLIQLWGKIPTPKDTVAPMEKKAEVSVEVAPVTMVFTTAHEVITDIDLLKLAASSNVEQLPPEASKAFRQDPVGFFSHLNANAREAVLAILQE